ncbi:MAG: hypothetical protein R8G60_02035 [Roseovarius pacificus]|nr:hypothetical protein [Roseovarius pacificus]
MAYSNAPHAHVHEAYTDNPGLGANAVIDFYKNWSGLEKQIKQLQNEKKALMATVRKEYGSREAQALKMTARLAGLPEDERKDELAAHAFLPIYLGYLDLDEDVDVLDDDDPIPND